MEVNKETSAMVNEQGIETETAVKSMEERKPGVVYSNEDYLLVWGSSVLREMFQRYRLWPSFIGHQMDFNTEAAGLLPVYLWPEQLLYFRDMLMRGRVQSGGLINVENQRDTDKSQDIITDANEFAQETEQTGNKRKFEGNSTAAEKRIKSNTDERFEGPETDASTGDVSLFQRKGGFLSSVLKHIYDSYDKGSQRTEQTRQREIIFSSCQRRNYFVGPADVYGGDYSLYRGSDPSNSHSVATVRVAKSKRITAKVILNC